MYAFLKFLSVQEDQFTRKYYQAFGHVSIKMPVPVKQELGTNEPQENGAEPAKKNHRRRRRRRPKKQNNGQSAANSVVPEDKNEIV